MVLQHPWTPSPKQCDLCLVTPRLKQPEFIQSDKFVIRRVSCRMGVRFRI